MSVPILYSFRRCPYAMRARMALLASGTPVEVREVKLAAKPDAMLAASPKGTVPVLVLPDGQVIAESLDVMRWALRCNDPEGWLTASDEESPQLVAKNDGAFKYHLNRYKYASRHGSDSEEHREACLDFMADLERRLGAAAQLTGPRRSLIDVAIMPFVRQFAETDRTYFDALPLPGVQRWLAWHLGSPLFTRAMERFPSWMPGDSPRLMI